MDKIARVIPSRIDSLKTAYDDNSLITHEWASGCIVSTRESAVSWWLWYCRFASWHMACVSRNSSVKLSISLGFFSFTNLLAELWHYHKPVRSVASHLVLMLISKFGRICIQVFSWPWGLATTKHWKGRIMCIALMESIMLLAMPHGYYHSPFLC